MNASKPTVDDCAQQGRSVLKVIFAALLAVAALLLANALGALDPWSERLHSAAPILPLAITVFCAWAWRRQHRAGGSAAHQPLWQAMFDDEFRRQSIARAVRVAFVFLLLVQLPLAFALGNQAAPAQLALMACLSMLAGAIAFLGAFLYFRRADA